MIGKAQVALAMARAKACAIRTCGEAGPAAKVIGSAHPLLAEKLKLRARGAATRSGCLSTGVLLSAAVMLFVTPADAQVKSKAPDDSRLWRVRAEYTYKGEPLVLEFGLACSSIWAGANTHKYSKDMFAGPQLYGVKTNDGKAVVMATRNFCDSGLYPKEPNGGLKDRFLPMTVVYDDTETLAFGTLYASDEAYQNSLAVLTIPRVTFTLLTTDAFVALQRAATPNVVRMASNNRMGTVPNDVAAPGRKPLVGNKCHGKRRVEIPEELKADFRAVWPETRPAYWLPDEPTTVALKKRISRVKFEGGWYGSGLASQDRGSGLKRHGGGGADRWHEYRPVYAWYPERLISRGVWNAAIGAWEPPVMTFNLETAEDRTRGFLYCYDDLGLIKGGTFGHHSTYTPSQHHLARMASRSAISVDGTPVQSAWQGDLISRDYFIVERDEALLVHEIMNLGPWGEQLDD